MSKSKNNQNNNISTDDIESPPQPTNATAASLKKRQGLATGRQRRLDADQYMEEEPDKQFMWINDLDGEVQKWLSIGAAPVERKSLSETIYPGLNDHKSNEYVKVHGGADEGGNPFYVYLLKMDKAAYEDVKLQPLKDRQAEILNAMGIGSGGMADESAELPSGNSLKTYAANNVTGSKGFAQQYQKV